MANCVAVLRQSKVSIDFLNLKSSSGMKFFHPSVRLTNQKPRAFVNFVSVCLLFLLCSRVSILRSYEIALSITWMVELNRGEAEENFLY